ncbi:hypothetical protein K2Y11_09560 [bacterium]|nr:hypothetical protein [bacterium]
MREVLIGQLQVVLGGNLLRVADPLHDDMQWIRFRQFCLASAAKVLPKLRPSR